MHLKAGGPELCDERPPRAGWFGRERVDDRLEAGSIESCGQLDQATLGSAGGQLRGAKRQPQW